VPDDPIPAEPTPPTAGIELEVDLGAFLPDATAIGPSPDGRSPTLAEGPRSPDEEPDRGEPPVDLAVLAGVEADLAAVDVALEAIDAGDPARSPLLVELLGSPPA
jgi:hypothetical protein